MSREVPEGWRDTSLGELILEMKGGGTPSRKIQRYWEGPIPWASVKDLKKPYLNATEEYISEDGLSSSASNIIPQGTIIIATRMAVGRAVRFSCDVAINQDLRAIFPKNELDTNYLHHWLRWRETEISRLGSGTTVAGIRQEVLKGLSFRIPPLHEQRKIAEVLSSVDDAIAVTQAMIEQTKKVKQATLERLLTKGIGHTRFKQTEIGEIPESWNVCKLSDIAKIKHGYAYSGEFFSKDERHSILITPGNFSKDKTLYFGNNTKYYDGPILKDFILKNGDILVVMTDLTPSMDILGNSVILNANTIVLHNQRIGKIEFLTNSVASEFLNNLLNSKRIQDNVKKTASGTTVRHTSPSRILENIIALPKKEEQLSISKIIDTFDSVINCQQIKLEHIRRLKSALLSDLLTGRKRVTDTLPLAAE